MMRTWIPIALVGGVLGATSPAALKSDISILVDNDLQGPESPTADAAVLFLGEDMTLQDGEAACADLGEQLWAPELDTGSIQRNLDFLLYQGKGNTGYWIAGYDGVPRGLSGSGDVIDGLDGSEKLPVLCTQTAPFSNSSAQDTDDKWRVSVRANSEVLTGYRDRNSFRFLGIRYAPEPERFTYAHPHKGQGGNVSALDYGSQCVQESGGSEDCLFLNVWTPHLPRPCKTPPESLKPVMFWIHGGAFTGGTANDPDFDGGNLASRGDVVVVAINYRLGPFGFLALEDGETSGNYGLADAILALSWVRGHIRAFGGDPERVTIFGQSAGGATVRAMIASPEARGNFAAAVPMSSPGGLGVEGYEKYVPISEAKGADLLEAANCSDVACLRDFPVESLSTLLAEPQYLVIDGKYLTGPGLDLSGETMGVHLMMGVTAEDGTAFIQYPPDTAPDDTEWITEQGLPSPPPDLFPPPDLQNQTLAADTVAARLVTDAFFRCINQATANALLETSTLAQVYFYEFVRTYQLADYPNMDLCEPEGRPDGDPSVPYLRCHSGELLYVFGNVLREGLPLRDESDLAFGQFVLDAFASFARTFDPNPEEGFLAARGYERTALALREAGRWEAAVGGDLKLRALEPAGGMEVFRDVEQCEWLELGLDYYL